MRRRVMFAALGVVVAAAAVFLAIGLSGSGFKRAGVDPGKAPRLVLAFYYGWYGTPDGPTGGWVHWNHPVLGTSRRHNPDSWVSRDRRDIGAAHYPLLGPYDSLDFFTVVRHIEWAKAAGIDGFIVSWWGRGTQSDKALGVVMAAAEELGFNVTVYYESAGLARDRPVKEIVEDFVYILEKYGRKPPFLKLEGKPVIFVYAVGVQSPAAWASVFSELRRRGLDAVFIGDTLDASYAKYFDGIHTYNPLGYVKGLEGLFKLNKYEVLAKQMADYFWAGPAHIAEKEKILFAATVLPGYDDRQVRHPGQLLDRHDGYVYNMTWRAALLSGARWVLITTWNEWHEGTEIEPSLEYGYKYLNLTRHWAEIFKERKD